MIYMGMCQKHIIHLCFSDRQITIFIYIDPLFHPVIHQDVFSACLQIMTASRHLMSRANKRQFHAIPPRIISF